MVLFSGDLTVIQDSIIKVSDKISRDFVELENLQSSHRGPEQFANMTIDFIKRKLFEYFKNKKPSYDIIFLDEQNDYDKLKSNFRYIINPLCGKLNLLHAIPYFAISISLQKKDKNNEFKTICGVIDSPITQETFIVEEGKGAYLNSRRIRVSSRSNLEQALVAINNVNDKNFKNNCINKYRNITITNCDILNICNVANGKYDITILQKDSINYELPLLLIKEAGGLIKKFDNNILVITNDLLYSQIKD